MLNLYPWPAVPRTSERPAWNGKTFRLGKAETPVLLYNADESHWSDDLTLMHEAEAGDGDHPIDLASRTLALATVRKELPDERGIILDVGCSSGFFLRDLRRTLPRAGTIGADYIAGPLRRLAGQLPGVPLLQLDLRKCPLPGESIDAVVCLNVLEHIDRDIQALAEIYRILKPGGVAHIEVPASPGAYDIYDEFLMHHRRYTMRELVTKAQGVGFKVESRTHLGALVFPAFYLVKRFNRRLLRLPAEEKAARVRKMMRTTRKSVLMGLAMRLEKSLGEMMSFPCGIRCVAVLRKPGTKPAQIKLGGSPSQ